jgi:hypothetical protein
MPITPAASGVCRQIASAATTPRKGKKKIVPASRDRLVGASVSTATATVVPSRCAKQSA